MWIRGPAGRRCHGFRAGRRRGPEHKSQMENYARVYKPIEFQHTQETMTIDSKFLQAVPLFETKSRRGAVVKAMESWFDSCNNKLCAWRHNMPPPLSSPRGRPSALHAAEQTQRSSTFPRPLRSHADRCSRLTR